MKKVNFSRAQKVVAAFLIFTLVLPSVVWWKRFPVFGDERDGKILAILVEKEIFNSKKIDDLNSVSGKIFRFARAAQNSLENTRGKIIPVSRDESAGNIFAVLENLFLNGENENRLSGVILIGEIPLPEISAAVNFSSIFPFVDFVDPTFIFDKNSQTFVKNPDSRSQTAEIFHGVISPKGTNKIAKLKTFFDKNFAFRENPQFHDEILIADFATEARAVNTDLFENYKLRQKYRGDLAFGRFNENFLQKINGQFFENLNSPTGDAEFDEKVSEVLQNLENKNVDFSAPDFATKKQIENLLPEFAKVVVGASRDAREKIDATGRWGQKSSKIVPALISQKDILAQDILRAGQIQFETKILEIVKKWQKPVKIPLRKKQIFRDDDENFAVEFDYFLNGISADEISNASQCSLVRGANFEKNENGFSQAVEFNKMYNFNDSENFSACEKYGGCCAQNSFSPEKCEPKNSTAPVFDFGGSQKSENSAGNFENCVFDCQFRKKAGTPRGNLISEKIETKTISSTFLHAEPDLPTLQNISAGRNLFFAKVPADATRGVDFQGAVDNLQKVIFPDLFAAVNFRGKFSPEIAAESLRAILQKKENEIAGQIAAENLKSFAAFVRNSIEKKCFFRDEFINSKLKNRGFLKVFNFAPAENFDKFQTAAEKFLRGQFFKIEGRQISTDENLWAWFLRQNKAKFQIHLRELLREKIPNYNGVGFQNFVSAGGGEIQFRILQNDGNLPREHPPQSCEDFEIFLKNYDSNFAANFIEKTQKFKITKLPPENFLRDEISDFLIEYFWWQNLTPIEKHGAILQNFVRDAGNLISSVIPEIRVANYPESPNFEIQKNENRRSDLKFENEKKLCHSELDSESQNKWEIPDRVRNDKARVQNFKIKKFTAAFFIFSKVNPRDISGVNEGVNRGFKFANFGTKIFKIKKIFKIFKFKSAMLSPANPENPAASKFLTQKKFPKNFKLKSGFSGFAVFVATFAFLNFANFAIAAYVPKIICDDGMLGCDEAATDDVQTHWIMRVGIPAWIETAILFCAGFAVVSIMVGGVIFLISFGKDEMKNKAKSAITAAIAGLLISIFAYAIVKIVENIAFPFAEK